MKIANTLKFNHVILLNKTAQRLVADLKIVKNNIKLDLLKIHQFDIISIKVKMIL